MRAILLVLAVLLFPASAGAAQVSGDYLMSVCAMDKDGKEIVPNGHVTCQSYIAGVMDYHSFTKSLGIASSFDFCIPKDLSLFEIHTKVQAFLLKHAAQYGPFIASPAVMVALNEAYPCVKKAKMPKRRN
jgi:hypothetical protein